MSRPNPRRPYPARHERPDGGDAFMVDPGQGPAVAPDDLAELAAEEFLASALSGEEVAYDDRDRVEPEEYGGPFVEERIPAEVLAMNEKRG